MEAPPDVDDSLIGQQQTEPAEPGPNRHRNATSRRRVGDGFDARCERSWEPDVQPSHPEMTALLAKAELVSGCFEGKHERNQAELLHEFAAGPRCLQ
jgi:hypothetical protein